MKTLNTRAARANKANKEANAKLIQLAVGFGILAIAIIYNVITNGIINPMF